MCLLNYGIKNSVTHFQLLIVFVVFLCLVLRCENIPVYDEPRLPATVIPFHYNIQLITHLENSSQFRYEGVVNISIHIQKETKELVLHAAGFKMNTKDITLWCNDQAPQLVKVRFNRRRSYMVLTFDKNLSLSRFYTLRMSFRRPMSDDSQAGYFVRHYLDRETSRKNWYSLTHFNRNSIRNTMPSFDEPSLRATFNVTHGHHKRYQSFSNMKVLKVLPNHQLVDYVWSVHETSPPIPTYLLAFALNNFTCHFSQSANAKPISFRTCSPAGQVRETTFAAQVAPQLLTHFEEILQVQLPLEKIDQLVVDNYPTAALENLGLVVYGSKLILESEQPGRSLTRTQLQTMELVAHEMAHMWFGNLLGLEWWTDLWLLEGLSVFLQSLAIDGLQPRMGQRMLVRNRESALMHETRMGGLKLVQRTMPIASDTFMFKKATSLIVMLCSTLGNTTFFDGLQRHLWQHTYESSTPDDFLRAMQLASERHDSLPEGYDVKTIMNIWTMQSGYPLVTVSRSEGGLDVVQSHALNENSTELWWIPLTFTIQGSADFQHTLPKAWLTPDQPQLHLNLSLPQNDWVIFNLQALGYYRVQYDELNLKLLAKALFNNFRNIHVLNRAQIVSDILFLRRQGRISWSNAFEVLKYILDEDEYEPLMAFVLGVTHGFWGLSPDTSISIAKWLGIAGKWYAEFISYTFDKFVMQEQSLNTLDTPH
ncbi:uncharacterized protein Dana_GF14970, isoform A [Drosophila ananassae]|uniref:Uncharacterized protein, isoform A n=1 Tax=Drosophila ananassae TaxID=7217 RepID=B3ML11_DROAN|nr:aminopeptidase Q [Drosophila ananassae]EDV30669.2 uncharacterized protein Dana_GF14970, isoform A [Drosophila ananassae]